MSTGSDVGPWSRRGAAAEIVQEKTEQKNMAQQKKMCSKFSVVVATANFQQKTKVCRFLSKISASCS
jgi:hypothetical protein